MSMANIKMEFEDFELFFFKIFKFENIIENVDIELGSLMISKRNAVATDVNVFKSKVES